MSELKSNYPEFLQKVCTPQSIAHFNKLERLSAPQEFLINSGFHRLPHPPVGIVDALPASIRHLTISCPTGKLLLWLEQLIDALDNFSLPETLALQCIPQRGRSSLWFKKRKTYVFDALGAKGVHVSVIDLPQISSPSQAEYHRYHLHRIDKERQYEGIASLFRDGSEEFYGAEEFCGVRW